MFRIKRLYTFMLQQFLPLFAMTFFICLFIVMMQFLWRYIDDLVGKGLSIGVISELFFYAALSMVPTALPLAVLLASLMTFGNLGEKLELTAMKASGISLFRIMRPLIILMTCVAIGAFFFQNNVLPIAQTKMWTLLFSMRQKSPEVEIPEKAFYNQIPGMNLYANSKNRDTGMLYDLIIYDVSRGMENPRVILSDSGKISFTEDKTHIFVHLYNGELFENLNNNSIGLSMSGYLPFRQESFTDKQIYIMFDANFNRMDESGMRSQYIGKNISELSQTIDSLKLEVDSIGTAYGNDIRMTDYFGVPHFTTRMVNGKVERVEREPLKLPRVLNIDSVFNSPSASHAKTYINLALGKAKRQRQDYEFRSYMLVEQEGIMRRHDIEMQKKFTLSFACLIFFFIGAPLGAIIKKGGIGTPLVISVLLFIVYFIIDNMGYKMARDGKTPVFEGIWLSSAVLLPMGIWLTYKAVGDSAVFNIDAYKAFFMRLIGKRPKRSLERKELIITEVDPAVALSMLTQLLNGATDTRTTMSKKPWVVRRLVRAPYRMLTTNMNDTVDYMSNTRDVKAIHYLNQYPFTANYTDLSGIINTTTKLIKRIKKSMSETDSVASIDAEDNQQQETPQTPIEQ